MTEARPVTRVVVVDDNEENAETLAALLEEIGCRASAAYDGIGALLLFEKEVPDVVLLDLSLPEMDGFEVAAEMRRRFGADFRIVAVTGFSAADYRERARQSGIDHFITKPVRLPQLEEVLRQCSAGLPSSPR